MYCWFPKKPVNSKKTSIEHCSLTYVCTVVKIGENRKEMGEKDLNDLKIRELETVNKDLKDKVSESQRLIESNN